jgi:hypothetical protein
MRLGIVRQHSCAGSGTSCPARKIILYKSDAAVREHLRQFAASFVRQRTCARPVLGLAQVVSQENHFYKLDAATREHLRQALLFVAFHFINIFYPADAGNNNGEAADHNHDKNKVDEGNRQ